MKYTVNFLHEKVGLSISSAFGWYTSRSKSRKSLNVICPSVDPGGLDQSSMLDG